MSYLQDLIPKEETKKNANLQYVFAVLLAIVIFASLYFFTGVFGETRIGISINTNKDLTNGLVAHYTFDGSYMNTASSTAEVLDRSGNGHNGNWTNLIGNESTLVPGVVGSAIDFDGGNDEVIINDSNLLDIADNLTLATWVFPRESTASNDEQFFICKRDGDGSPDTNYQFGFAYASAGTYLQFSFRIDDTWYSYKTDTAQLRLNEWAHVLVSYTSGSNAKIYIDGEEAASSQIEGGASDPTLDTTSDPVYLANCKNMSERLDGKLDDARIYNRVLSPSEVKRLYQLGATAKINTTINTNPDLKNGLVGHWTFDGGNIDTSANTSEIKDISGNANHGDWLAHATTTVPGKIGQALKFDGVDDKVSVPDDASLAPSEFTLSLWLQRTGDCTGSYEGIFESAGGDGYYTGFALVCITSDRVELRWGDGAADGDINGPESYLPYGEWHFVLASYDGTTMKLYFDGELVASDNTVSFAYGTTDPLELANTAGTLFFDGKMDDVRLYNRVLSDKQIERLYGLGATTKINKTITTNPDLEDGLIAHYTFDGKDTDTASNTAEVLDSSGNSNNANWLDHATTTAPGKIGQAIEFNANDFTIEYNREQYDVSSEADPASATFGSTPISGNLLVVTAVGRSGYSHTNYTISGTGWTKQVGHDGDLGDSSARRTLVVWTKTAGASEPTTITVDNGQTNNKKILIEEFSPNASATWTFKATSTSDTGPANTSPTSTGATASVSGPDLLLLGQGVWRNEGNNSLTSVGWTNSLGTTITDVGGYHGLTISSAFVKDDTTGTKETTLSWSGTGHEALASITVFKAEATETSSTTLIDAGNLGSGIKTIAFWIKTTDNTSRPLINIDGTDKIELNGSGQIVATSFPSATTHVDGSSVSSYISVGAWHHVVVTDSTGVNASSFEIGGVDPVYFDGVIDDVRIYDRVLSDAEIERLYKLGN